MRFLKNIVIIFSIAFFVRTSGAKVDLPKVFGDNMVLQRQKPVRVWGTSAPNAKVEINFASQHTSTFADAAGKWHLYLDAMEADFSPKDFVVKENDKNALKLSNVLVGEVWFLGGQDNMALPLEKSAEFKKVQPRGNYRYIRYLKIRENGKSKTHWELAVQENIGNMGAIAFHFAEELQKNLRAPIGLVDLAERSSQMRSWIAADDFKEVKFLENDLSQWRQSMKKYDFKNAKKQYEKDLQNYQNLKGRKEKNLRPPEAPNADTCRKPANTPAYFYNKKIRPLEGFAARGILWYQGESDTKDNDGAKFFGEQLSLLINSSRKKWKDESLQFVCAQLASRQTDDDLPNIRWQQYLVSEELQNVYLVNMADMGDKNRICPTQKAEAAHRLANTALRRVYGKKNVRALSPRPSIVSYKDDFAEVQFKLAGRKLNGRGASRGFEIKTGDNWVPAKAELRGNIVLVKSPNPAAKISGIRYLWKSWAADEAWLFNEDGLPAFPFINLK